MNNTVIHCHSNICHRLTLPHIGHHLFITNSKNNFTIHMTIKVTVNNIHMAVSILVSFPNFKRATHSLALCVNLNRINGLMFITRVQVTTTMPNKLDQQHHTQAQFLLHNGQPFCHTIIMPNIHNWATTITAMILAMIMPQRKHPKTIHCTNETQTKSDDNRYKIVMIK